MGMIFDSACQLWDKKCGARRSCHLYDTRDLSIKMMILQLFIHVSSTILAGCAVFCYRKPVVDASKKEEVEKMSSHEIESLKDDNADQ